MRREGNTTMFTKTLIAAATALSVFAGVGAASANPYSYNYAYDADDYGHWVVKEVITPRKACETIYETKTWHDYYGWHTSRFNVGEKCVTVYDSSFVKVWVASY